MIWALAVIWISSMPNPKPKIPTKKQKSLSRRQKFKNSNNSSRGRLFPLLCKEGLGEVETYTLPHLSSPYKGEGSFSILNPYQIQPLWAGRFCRLSCGLFLQEFFSWNPVPSSLAPLLLTSPLYFVPSVLKNRCR